LEITADGFKKDDISIEIKDNVLVLSANKTEKKVIKPTASTAIDSCSHHCRLLKLPLPPPPPSPRAMNPC
jgi:hypothetical protein